MQTLHGRTHAWSMVADVSMVVDVSMLVDVSMSADVYVYVWWMFLCW